MTRARWTRVRSEERGRGYVDYVCGVLRIAQGYDEPARREGRPYTLLERGQARGTFATVDEAKRAASGQAPSTDAIPTRRRRAPSTPCEHAAEQIAGVGTCVEIVRKLSGPARERALAVACPTCLRALGAAS